MDEASLTNFRAHLLSRRRRLERVIHDTQATSDLVNLLREVDSALERVSDGTYGVCRTCHDSIEDDLLHMDPLACFCFDHLDAGQRRALEYDLELASRIQAALLPKKAMSVGGWRVHYHYQPAGPVSGDYVDVVPSGRETEAMLFIVGDVTGKGVAASMLTSHLHAVVHTLATINLATDQLVSEANRLLCESSMPSFFATLVCGKALKNGQVEICNAGHLSPILIHGDKVSTIESTGLPVGVLCDHVYSVSRVQFDSGDRLLLYTDGLSEAASGEAMYGEDRVAALARKNRDLAPEEFIAAYMTDLVTFTSGKARQDDLSIMVVERAE
jgi:sigma-B regulation protein RsbU (phosphoserine phosphatase)